MITLFLPNTTKKSSQAGIFTAENFGDEWFKKIEE